MLIQKQNCLNFCARKKIEYQNPTTASMAKMLGKKQLGIVEYRNFDADSLELLNFINRGLVDAQNATRNKIRIPSNIDLEELPKAQMSTKYNGGILTVNKNIYHPDKINFEITRMSKEMLKDGVIIQSQDSFNLNEAFNDEKANEFFNFIGEKFGSDLSRLSYEEKLDLYHHLRVVYEQTSQLNRFPKDLIIKMFEAGCWGEFSDDIVELFTTELKSATDNNNFKILFEFIKEFGEVNFNFDYDIFKNRTIYHEVGHLQDYDLFFEPDVGEFDSFETYPKELKLWLNDKENLKTAFSVSPYACYGKNEFFAECYSMLLQGRKLPPKAQELYKKIKAPKVYLK